MLILLASFFGAALLTVCGGGAPTTATPTQTVFSTVGVATPIPTVGETSTAIPTVGGTPVLTAVPGGNPQEGKLAIEKYQCGACHLIPGIPGATGTVAVPLAGFANRPTIVGVVPNTAANLIRWIENPQAVVPTASMPALGVTEPDARNIAAYLATLTLAPAVPATPTAIIVGTPTATAKPAATIVGTPTPVAKVVPGGNPELGKAAIEKYGCGACHTIPGIPGALGEVGPSLAGFAERATIAAQIPNTPENLIRWIENPQALKPGTAMPNLGVTEPDARNIAAYLYTLK